MQSHSTTAAMTKDKSASFNSNSVCVGACEGQYTCSFRGVFLCVFVLEDTLV